MFWLMHSHISPPANQRRLQYHEDCSGTKETEAISCSDKGILLSDRITCEKLCLFSAGCYISCIKYCYSLLWKWCLQSYFFHPSTQEQYQFVFSAVAYMFEKALRSPENNYQNLTKVRQKQLSGFCNCYLQPTDVSLSKGKIQHSIQHMPY